MTLKKETETTPAARKRPESQARVVKKIRERVEQKLSESDAKVTLGDYIRLVQLEKELEDDEPKEIKVTWVNPDQTTSDSEK